MRILFALAVLIGLGVPANAVSDADRLAVQQTIERQLNAFLADDAAAAYSFAAPNITARFPTADIFMQMVEQGYPQVHRWRSYEFAALEEMPQGLRQDVDIVDAAGEFWTATYTLERQADGSWKITGCYLQKKPGEMA